MKLAEVEAAVAEIAAIRWDAEMAHSREDELHQRVLSAIADGTAEQPAEMAAAALKTQEIDFARWCA